MIEHDKSFPFRFRIGYRHFQTKKKKKKKPKDNIYLSYKMEIVPTWTYLFDCSQILAENWKTSRNLNRKNLYAGYLITSEDVFKTFK